MWHTSTPAQQSQGMQDMMKMHEQMMADMKAADASSTHSSNRRMLPGGETKVNV